MKIRLVPRGDIELRCVAVMKQVVLFRGVLVTVGIPVKNLSTEISGLDAELFVLADSPSHLGLHDKMGESGCWEPRRGLVFRTR
jgi:hypothetical protein